MTHRLLLSVGLTAIAAVAQVNETWRKPIEPFRIVGNLYYVGTKDLACYLITTPQGHILVNTGLADSTPLIRASMTKLSFKIADIRILLTMQAHFDHVAAMAEVQKLSKAKMYATEGDRAALESGGKIDGFDAPGAQFAPVRVDRILKDGDLIELGGMKLTVLSHPGHTRGSSSYQFVVDAQGVKKDVLLVNLPSVVQSLVGNQMYPNIVDDYERTFAAQKKLHPGIWLAGHASQCNLEAKHSAGSFDDPKGYEEAVADYERNYRAQLAKEAAAIKK